VAKHGRSFAAMAFAVVVVAVGACSTDDHRPGAPTNGAAMAPRPVNRVFYDAMIINPPQGNQKASFKVFGKEYFTLESIIPALNEGFDQEGRRAPPLTDRIGGKIKVVLTTFRQGNTTIQFADPESTEFAQRALREYALAAARGQVQTLRSSGLFDTVTVETADVSDVPLAGYDVVLWQPAAHPWTWRFRVAGKGDAFTLVSPAEARVVQFAEIVRDNIRKTGVSP
jgi:hypothetical protein